MKVDYVWHHSIIFFTEVQFQDLEVAVPDLTPEDGLEPVHL